MGEMDGPRHVLGGGGRAGVAALCFFALAFAPPAAAEEPAFHASLDRDFSAVLRGSPIAGKHTQPVLWETLNNHLLQSGIDGQAALVGRDGDDPADHHAFSFEAPDMIRPESGTVSFWVKPLDWLPTDRNFHIFFEARGANSQILIYKHRSANELFFTYGRQKAVDEDRGFVIARAPIRHWKKDEWHFVACAWDGKSANLFVDGLIVDHREVRHLPEGPFKTIWIGGNAPSWRGPQNQTLIDDVRVYDDALPVPDVAELYGGYRVGRLESDTSPLEIRRTFGIVDPEKKELTVTFVLSRTRPDLVPYEVDVDLRGSDGRSLSAKRFVSRGLDYKDVFGVGGLAPGRYKVNIAPVAAEDEKIEPYDLDFAVPSTPPIWEVEKAGVIDTVPPPWTDLVVADAPAVAVECWGRRYVFGDSLFPREIVSGGLPLLADPIRLEIDGRAFAAPATVNVVKRAPASVELEAEADDGETKLVNKITIEYDGFMWMRLDVFPKAGKLRSLALEAPMRKEASSLFNLMRQAYTAYETGGHGLVPETGLEADLRLFNPVVHLGSETRGLQWFAENLKGWHNLQPGRTMQIITRPGHRALRLNLVDGECDFAAGRRYEFGFQATPVRPLSADWRGVRIMNTRKPFPADLGADRVGKNLDPWFVWTSLHNYPDAERKIPDYDERRRNSESFGVGLCHYLAGFTISPHIPEWPWWGMLWSKIPPPPRSFMASTLGREHRAAHVCPNAGSFVDFYTWKLRTALDEVDIKNIYVDNQSAQRCRNPDHGCGWRDDKGVWRETYNVLGTRELNKRVYALVKARNPEGLVARHMSFNMVAPVLSFADIILGGESYLLDLARNESYYGIFEPGMFRAANLSTLLGIPNLFIPQFERAIINHAPDKLPDWRAGKIPDQARKLRHFKGYFLVHDAKVWPNWGIDMDDFWRFEDRIGLDGRTPFLGYWDPENPFRVVEPDSGRIMVSAYVDAGKVVLVAMNDTDADQIVKIAADAEKLRRLGFEGALEFSDADNAEAILVPRPGDGVVECALPARDYRIWFRAGQVREP